MKLYAQHGFAPADKINKAIEMGFIGGVILSPRHLTPESARQIIQDIREVRPNSDILIDPEFYATRYIGAPNAQLRNLDQWPYFMQRRQNELLTNAENIDATLRNAYQVQIEIGCSSLIAPNIYISGSFDSIEAAIAVNFISRAKIVAELMGATVPVYSTMAVCKDATLNRSEYINFLNMITALNRPPDGIYALIGTGSTDVRAGTPRSELIVPEVIGAWMLLNYTLHLNGMTIINGCSDILTPLLGIAQGNAGATGWWSNLQVFSMGRYIRGQGGGQPPLIRYLSKKLLNRITIHEREAFAEVVPNIMNGLETDIPYQGREPGRTEEALQSWQALSTLNTDCITGDLNVDLTRFEEHIVQAQQYYDELYSYGFSERYEANKEYLEALKDSINVFRELAEI